MAASDKSWWSKDTIAVVTGANKGIGLELARQLAKKGVSVVLTARDQARGQAALDALKAEGLECVSFHQLDVSSVESVEKLATWLKQEYGGIDILINNAGVVGNTLDYKNAKVVVDTNYYGSVQITRALLPLMRASPHGARVVNVTSRTGLYERLGKESLKEQFRAEDKYTQEFVDSMASKYLEDVKVGRHIEEGWLPSTATPMYSESKIFLNAHSAVLAKSLQKSQSEDHQILVTSFCPGVTQTELFELAAKNGFRQPEGFPVKTLADGADTGVWLALLPKEELLDRIGKLFGERQEYPFSLFLQM